MRGLIALAALAIEPELIPERLPPVESCARETGFNEFRTRLTKLVAARDERALLAMLSDDVEVNFGGDRGPALFAANWKFDEPGESNVWAELQDALTMGCTQTGDALVAPSFVANLPAELDAFETIIASPGAQLRAAPREEAEVIGSLNWHLASMVDDHDEIWIGVRLVDGRKGFIRRDQAVNPLDFRLVFEKRHGKWMVTAFVAGD